MSYAAQYRPTYIPNLKPLAIVEQDELNKLKQKKLELELKLKKKELQQKEDENEQPTIVYNEQQTPKKVRQQPQPQLQPQQQSKADQFQQLKDKERAENEKKELKATIAHLEKEKRTLQNQFELIKEGIRQDNMKLKEQSIKCKVEAESLQKQLDLLDDEKNRYLKENKQMKNELKVLQDRIQVIVKDSSEYQSKSQSNKDIVMEREDRIRWFEQRLADEERHHKATHQQVLHLQNDIHNLKRENEFQMKDRERLAREIEELMFSHTKKQDELHEGRLRDQRDINEAKLGYEEYRKNLHIQSEKIRQLELERERHLTKLEDMNRIECKLAARDREIVELEVELDRIRRMKGTHVIEKIIEPVAYQVPVYRDIVHPQEDVEIVQLREDLLYLQQDRDRALDEADYWRKRYQDLELAGDRNTNLMAHQNLDEVDRNAILREQKQEIFTKVMGLINDMSTCKRNSNNKDVQNAIEQILNNNSDLVKYLMS